MNLPIVAENEQIIPINDEGQYEDNNFQFDNNNDLEELEIPHQPPILDIENYQEDDIRLQIFQDRISTLITPLVGSSSIKSGIEQLLRSNWVHGIFNPDNHGAPLFNDVMDIFDFVSQFSLSTPQGDGLLLLIKKILLRHPTYEEVYLHQRFRSVSSLLDNALSGVYDMSITHIPLPIQLRGGNSNIKREEINRILNSDGENPDLIIASGYSINLMQLIAEMLITISI